MTKSSSHTMASFKTKANSPQEVYKKIVGFLEHHGVEEHAALDRAFSLCCTKKAASGVSEQSMEALQLVVILTKEMGIVEPDILVAALLYKTVGGRAEWQDCVAQKFGKHVVALIEATQGVEAIVKGVSTLETVDVEKIFALFAKEAGAMLLQLAARLHDLRCLAILSTEEQLRLALECKHFYAPIANRLGFKDVKATLEDFYLKCHDPAAYFLIAKQLKKKKRDRIESILLFHRKVEKALQKQDLDFRIETRIKSIFSIYQKVKNRNIPLDQIYDLVALRVIIKCTEAEENRKCWQVYQAIIQLYKPNNLRTRAWLKVYRANGYQSLHTTIMNEEGGWIEVQIRSDRMHEVASVGDAAHWKYKEDDHRYNISAFDGWLCKVREWVGTISVERLQWFEESSSHDFYKAEIAVFDDKGDIFILPRGATVLDFALAKLGEAGLFTTHALIHEEAVPLQYILSSQSKVTLHLSGSQTPNESWSHFLATPKARNILATYLKNRRIKSTERGQKLLQCALKEYKLTYDTAIGKQLLERFEVDTMEALYCGVGDGTLPAHLLYDALKEVKERMRHPKLASLRKQTFVATYEPTSEPFCTIQACCTPLVQEPIFAFITLCERVHIHSKACSKAAGLLNDCPDRVAKAVWMHEKESVEVILNVISTEEEFAQDEVAAVLAEYDTHFLFFSYNCFEDRLEGTAVVALENVGALEQVVQLLCDLPHVDKVVRLRGTTA